MRSSRSILAAAAAAAVAVALAVPGTALAATTANGAASPKTAIIDGHLAVAIPLRPGRHTVSDAVLQSARSYSPQAAASSSPEIQVRVGPSSCAGYNGEVIVGWLPYLASFYIQTYGVLWDDCYNYYSWPSTVYVYVSYSELGEPRQNFEAASQHNGAPPGASTGVDTGPVTTAGIASPSDIVITACIESIDGWQCGAGQKV